MSAQITILGNTGRAVEFNYTPQGVPVAKFSLASNVVRNTSQGRVEKTDWYSVSAFGRQAETLARYLNKGAAILVRGRLSLSAWQTREGEPRVNADVILQDFEFAGSGIASAANQTVDTDPSEAGEATDNDGMTAPESTDETPRMGAEAVSPGSVATPQPEAEPKATADPLDDILNDAF